MIKLVNVNKQYKVKNNIVNALENINLTLPNKGFYSITGESGSGKTTLINALAGIDKVSSGDIYYNDLNITKIKGSKLDNYRSNVAFVFQDYNLINEYNVKDNIALSLRIQGRKKKKINKIVDDTLLKVGLPLDYKDRRITELSGGEQQRVVIARALAKKSKIILCDEPTGNLDKETANEIFSLLKEISDKALIGLVSHDKELTEKYSDGIIEIDKGKITRNDCNSIESFKNKIRKLYRSNLMSLVLKLSFENIKTFLYALLAMLLIFVSVFTIGIIDNSISRFDEDEALIETLKENDQTIIKLTNYCDICDEVVDDYGTFYKNSVVIGSTKYTQYSNIDDLKTKIGNKAQVLESYLFYKPFSAFSNIDYPFETDHMGDDDYFHFRAFNFDSIIAVDDFKNVSIPLSYGKLPEKENEILIYDYMADNLLYHKVFNGSIEDVVDKSLHDKSQDMTFIISGIIKSNYKEFEYTDNTYYLDELNGIDYLSNLKTIFMSKSLFNKINLNINSIPGVKLRIEDDESNLYNDFSSLVFDSNEYEFIEKASKDTKGYSVSLTESQVGKLIGVNRKATNQEIKEFMKNDPILTINLYYYDNDANSSYYTEYLFNIQGVISDDCSSNLNSIIINSNTRISDGLPTNRYYLALNKDYSNAEEVLEMLKVPEHTEEYYSNCIKERNFYYKGGFCIDDYSSSTISDAKTYLLKTKNIATDAKIIFYIITALAIIGFCYFSIKSRSYKIGVLKSLGTKNFALGLSFILSIFFVTILSFMISIFTSYIFMNKINSNFSNHIENIKLILFNIKSIDFIIPLIISFVICLISSISVYILFTIKPPVTLIRQNTER